MGKEHQCANGVKDFCYHAVGCVRVVLCNVAAYVVQVPVGFRVKRVSAHAGRLRSASVLAFRRAKASSPSIGFTLPLFPLAYWLAGVFCRAGLKSMERQTERL